jgi:preprotein translocase subunit SecA
VQLIGGMVLHDGAIAEMKTGEGKTLTATLAVFLNTLAGTPVHLVTVNDYLARRDAQWMGPIYDALGVSVGVIQAQHDPDERQRAYACDVAYGTNSEFGFDYLRDNMSSALEYCVQREHAYAIVDEVDNILIDEARTPLIISGQPEQAADLYYKFAKLAKIMEPGKKPEGLEAKSKDWEADFDFEPDEKHKTVSVSEKGVAKAEDNRIYLHRVNVLCAGSESRCNIVSCPRTEDQHCAGPPKVIGLIIDQAAGPEVSHRIVPTRKVEGLLVGILVHTDFVAENAIGRG